MERGVRGTSAASSICTRLSTPSSNQAGHSVRRSRGAWQLLPLGPRGGGVILRSYLLQVNNELNLDSGIEPAHAEKTAGMENPVGYLRLEGTQNGTGTITPD